jgi:hypothetical protein
MVSCVWPHHDWQVWTGCQHGFRRCSTRRGIGPTFDALRTGLLREPAPVLINPVGISHCEPRYSGARETVKAHLLLLTGGGREGDAQLGLSGLMRIALLAALGIVILTG